MVREVWPNPAVGASRARPHRSPPLRGGRIPCSGCRSLRSCRIGSTAPKPDPRKGAVGAAFCTRLNPRSGDRGQGRARWQRRGCRATALFRNDAGSADGPETLRSRTRRCSPCQRWRGSASNQSGIFFPFPDRIAMIYPRKAVRHAGANSRMEAEPMRIAQWRQGDAAQWADIVEP
jgi:hypothetical protein